MRGFCGLTFELSRHRRWDARPGLAKMYRVPPDRAWRPAVGARLERGVRHQFGRWREVVQCATGNAELDEPGREAARSALTKLADL